MKRALPMMALAMASIAAGPGPAPVPAENRGPDPNEPPLPFAARRISKARTGWIKGGDCPKHRSKAERNKRKAARRARARNAKGGR